jgi:hypothetical protein
MIKLNQQQLTIGRYNQEIKDSWKEIDANLDRLSQLYKLEESFRNGTKDEKMFLKRKIEEHKKEIIVLQGDVDYFQQQINSFSKNRIIQY